MTWSRITSARIIIKTKSADITGESRLSAQGIPSLPFHLIYAQLFSTAEFRLSNERQLVADELSQVLEKRAGFASDIRQIGDFVFEYLRPNDFLRIIRQYGKNRGRG